MFLFSEADIERFLEKCEAVAGPLPTQCWEWTGAKSRGKGNLKWYGTFKIEGGKKAVRAHKFSFVAIGKRIWVPGNHLDHLCENSLCVRPCHLEMVAPEINQARKGRNHDYDKRH